MKTTIKDIAKIANVSTATVSKVLNKKDRYLSNETREKVLAIAKELNYVANSAARSLVTKQTKTIGLVIPDITNPFFPELARGAEDKASEAGYNIIFCNTDDDMQKEEKYIDMLIEKMVDGIIFTQSARRTKSSGKLKSTRIPTILIDRDMDFEWVKGKVLIDNLTGAYQAVNYLLGLGRRKIAFITGALTTNTARERLAGYKKALVESGIPFNKKYVLEGHYRSEWGFEAVNQLLNAKMKFDAVFCGNDLIAISVIKALKNIGISVPEDVSVIGFDDIYMASLIDPELTTVRQPNYTMGYKAVELLVDVIEKPSEEIKERKVILNTELVIRKST